MFSLICCISRPPQATAKKPAFEVGSAAPLKLRLGAKTTAEQRSVPVSNSQPAAAPSAGTAWTLDPHDDDDVCAY